MKINEIWGGGSIGGVAKQLYKRVAGDTNYQADKAFAQKAQTWAKPSDTPAAPPAAPAAAPSPTAATLAKAQPAEDGWISTPSGVQVAPATGDHPTVARYNKQVYSLTDKGTWIDVRDKPIGTTLATLLNKALEQT